MAPVPSVIAFPPPPVDGIGFTSLIVDLSAGVPVGGPDVQIWNGFAYGFQLIQIGETPTNDFFYVKVRGVNKVNNDVLMVVPGMYYEMPFDALWFTEAPRGVTVPQNASSPIGTFIVNICINPNNRILPVEPFNRASVPAASGGAAAETRYTTADVLLTRAAPTFGAITGGVAIPPGASMYGATLVAPNGQTITGGNVDIYRFLYYAANPPSGTAVPGFWTLAAAGIPVPTGYRAGSIPNDQLNPVSPYLATPDLLYVAPNGVTLSGAGTTVQLVTRIQ